MSNVGVLLPWFVTTYTFNPIAKWLLIILAVGDIIELSEGE